MSAFQSLARQIGLPPLDFSLDERSRGKILRVSILPFVVLSAVAVRLVLDLIYRQFLLASFAPEVGGRHEPWSHAYRFATGIASFEPVALATLFAFGIGKWSRREGSWMLVVGAVLATLSAAAVIYLTVAYLFADSSQSLQDFRVTAFSQFAFSLGLLSIGYFFLAYRGLASQPPRSRLRRVRRRAPPPGPSPVEG